MDTISFVIRTKDEVRDIEKTCKLIRNQKGDFNTEIIIVDSGSSDGTLEVAQKYADIVVNIMPKDFSWGAALNMGIEVAHGKYIFLLSAHCFFVADNTVQKGIGFLSQGSIIAVYGKQIGDKNKNVYEYVELNEIYPSIYLETSDNCRIHGISNACCMLMKDVWKYNRFDEQMQSSEDLEWYERMTKQGYILGYTDEIQLIHGHYYNPQYVYKKNYWREYTGRACQNYKFNLLNRTKIYIWTNRLLHSIKQYIMYKKAFKKLEIEYVTWQLIFYSFLCDYAILKARIDYISGKVNKSKYEEIDVPQFILKNGRLENE